MINHDTPSHSDLKKYFKNMYLKKGLKENHNHPILHICFNPHHPNLLATIGGTEASIYDNENCGEHMDLALNFVNLPTPALMESYYLRSHYENLKFKPKDTLTLSEQECILNGYDEDIFVGELRRETEKKEELPANKSHSSVIAEVTMATNPIFSSGHRLINHATWVSFPKPGPANQHGHTTLDHTTIDPGDTWLAICGNDGFVQLISVAFAKVLYILHGHHEPVNQLTTWMNGTILASLSDNYIVLWDIYSVAMHHYNSLHYGGSGWSIKDFCLQKIRIQTGSIQAIAFSNHGLICGGNKGFMGLYSWIMHPDGKLRLSGTCLPLKWPYSSHVYQIESHMTLKNSLIARSSDGDIIHFCIGDPEYAALDIVYAGINNLLLQINTVIKLKKGSTDRKCKFGLSFDGQYLVVGNTKGTTYLYSLQSGLLIHSLEHRRLSSSVLSCTISHHGKNIISASASILWRWDYIPQDVVDMTKKKMKRLKKKRKSRESMKSDEF